MQLLGWCRLKRMYCRAFVGLWKISVVIWPFWVRGCYVFSCKLILQKFPKNLFQLLLLCLSGKNLNLILIGSPRYFLCYGIFLLRVWQNFKPSFYKSDFCLNLYIIYRFYFVVFFFSEKTALSWQRKEVEGTPQKQLLTPTTPMT